MAVLIEAYSVVVRVATIEAEYPDGLEAYRRDCPNASFCSDGRLCRVGFMVHADAEAFVTRLAAAGLTPTRRGSAQDVAIVSQVDGAMQPCDWLELGRYRGSMIAWPAGSDVGDLHAPAAWDPDRPLEFASAAGPEPDVEFVRSEGETDVYRERATGRKMYVGRTSRRSREDDARHDERYDRACGLVEGLILIDGRPPRDLDDEARHRLESAIPLFGEVVDLNPGNWAAMWVLGKVYQRLDDFGRALAWFARAHRVNPDQPDVAREASIAAMEAVSFCGRAIEARPDDAGLPANLALALLFCERPVEAKEAVVEALRRSPEDPITRQIAAIVDEVLGGARPCPHHVRDLEPSP